MFINVPLICLRRWMLERRLPSISANVCITALECEASAKIEAAIVADLAGPLAPTLLDRQGIDGKYDIAGFKVSVGGLHRTDTDYAVEFGGYLADRAQYMLAFLRRATEAGDMTIEDHDGYADACRGLDSAVHEFRKRAARAKA